MKTKNKKGFTPAPFQKTTSVESPHHKYISGRTKPHPLKVWGFTLIEILMVIAIIGIISVLVLMTVSVIKNKAKKTKTKAQMSKIIEVIILAQGDTGKYLKDITGSFCTDCGACPGCSSCRGRQLRNIPETDGCYIGWVNALTKIQNASGGGIQLNINNFKRDPWGSPYGLDENEGENKWKDSICSAGPNGILTRTGIGDGKDDICFSIPYAKN